MSSTHTSHEFEAELRELRSDLLAMGARCEQALRNAVSAFINRDATDLEEMKRLDQRIDRDEMELDELALRVIALRQPVAQDLRFLAMVLKVVTDLERVGDKAVSIARRVKDVAPPRTVPPHPEIEMMGTLGRQMLRDALDAFVEADVTKAEAVLVRDDEVDTLCRQMMDRVATWMSEHPTDIQAGLAVLSVARHLERVADHATNLAEQVVFLVRGEDVRHRARLGVSS